MSSHQISHSTTYSQGCLLGDSTMGPVPLVVVKTLLSAAAGPACVPRVLAVARGSRSVVLV